MMRARSKQLKIDYPLPTVVSWVQERSVNLWGTAVRLCPRMHVCHFIGCEFIQIMHRCTALNCIFDTYSSCVDDLSRSDALSGQASYPVSCVWPDNIQPIWKHLRLSNRSACISNKSRSSLTLHLIKSPFWNKIAYKKYVSLDHFKEILLLHWLKVSSLVLGGYFLNLPFLLRKSLYVSHFVTCS